MNVLVVYGSRFGTTRRLAEAMADGLRTRLGATAGVEPAETAIVPAGVDLLLVGGPTEGHRVTPVVAEFLERLRGAELDGLPAAAFDTRVDWPRWLSGAASQAIARGLRLAGARVVTPSESFLVRSTGGGGNPRGAELLEGELERAALWALAVAEEHLAPAPVAA